MQKDYRKDVNYFALYDLESYEFSYTTTDGVTECTTTGTFKLPILISKMWATKLLGESPAIKIKGTEVNESFDQDIISQFMEGVEGIMGIGRIFVNPYMNKNGELNYDIIIEDRDNVKFYEENDELLYLKYTKSELMIEDGQIRSKSVVYEHTFENGAYFLRKYVVGTDRQRQYLDGFDGSNPISKEKMLPFKVDLNLSFTGLAKPVWANTYMLIVDVYNTYTLMNGVKERLVPMIALPAPLAKRGPNNAKIIGNASKVFVQIPGLNQQLKPEYFGGGYNPEPYIKDMDVALSMISEHCGLGHRALSYDQELGILKTATEVTYSNNDKLINKSLLDKTVNEFVKKLLSSYYYMKENAWLTSKEIEITNEDSVYNSRAEYVQQLQYDLGQGVITKEFYLQEVYPDQNVDDIINQGNPEDDLEPMH